MDDAGLSALVARASKIAEAAPATMRVAAFETILRSMLTGELDESPPGRTPKKKPRARQSAKKIAKKKAASPEDDSNAVSKRSKSRKGAGGRPGPRAAVEQLIDGGFLSTARTNKEIREELRHSKGWTYTATDLSPTLVRLLRDDRLAREKNAEGQYEFRAA